MAEITLTGNLTDDPKEITTQNGIMVVFTVAYTRRRQVDGEWVDGNTSYFDCRVFNGLGQNALASLVKGSQVTLVGDLDIVRTTKDDKQYTNAQIRVRELGASLRFATAELTKSSGKAKVAASIIDE